MRPEVLCSLCCVVKFTELFFLNVLCELHCSSLSGFITSFADECYHKQSNLIDEAID